MNKAPPLPSSLYVSKQSICRRIQPKTIQPAVSSRWQGTRVGTAVLLGPTLMVERDQTTPLNLGSLAFFTPFIQTQSLHDYMLHGSKSSVFPAVCHNDSGRNVSSFHRENLPSDMGEGSYYRTLPFMLRQTHFPRHQDTGFQHLQPWCCFLRCSESMKPTWWVKIASTQTNRCERRHPRRSHRHSEGKEAWLQGDVPRRLLDT